MCKCICGSAVSLDEAFVLDCKHNLCQGCSRVWSNAKHCPACRITAALEKNPVDTQDLVAHLETMYDRYKRLVTEKQTALRAEWKTHELMQQVSSERDVLAGRYRHLAGLAHRALETWKAGLETNIPTVKAPIVADDDSKLRIKKPSQGSDPPRQRKRRKVEGDDTDNTATTATTESIDDPSNELLQIVESGTNHLHALRAQHLNEVNDLKSKLEQLQSTCEQKDNQISTLTARCEAGNAYIRVCGMKAAAADELKAVNIAHAGSLEIISKELAEVKSQLEVEQQKVGRAEFKATQYEEWARRTKSYYKKQMEESKSPAASPSYPSSLEPPSPQKPSVRMTPTLFSPSKVGNGTENIPTTTMGTSSPVKRRSGTSKSVKQELPSKPPQGVTSTAESDTIVRTADPRTPHRRVSSRTSLSTTRRN